LSPPTATEAATATVPATPYERLGGRPTLHSIVSRFYDLMDADPAYTELRAMHAEDLAPLRESLIGYFPGWAGGPRDWFQQGKCVMSLHRPLPITPATARQWIAAMHRAIDETVGGHDPDIAKAMVQALAQMATGMAGGARH